MDIAILHHLYKISKKYVSKYLYSRNHKTHLTFIIAIFLLGKKWPFSNVGEVFLEILLDHFYDYKIWRPFATCVDVRSSDKFWKTLMDWLGENRLEQYRSLEAVTDSGYISQNRDVIKYQPNSSIQRLPWDYENIYLHRWVKHNGLNSEDHATLVCSGRSLSHIQDFQKMLLRWKEDRNKEKTMLYEPSIVPWRRERGIWEECPPQEIRDLNTVFVDEGSKNEIIEDINNFLSDEKQQWYRSTSLPVRRGYLFSGPPGKQMEACNKIKSNFNTGTGKSSFIQALAGKYGLSVYKMSLASINGPEFLALLKGVPYRSILLFEDVDASNLQNRADGNETKDDKRAQLPLSTLMNGIDGLGAPQGRILIITSNYPEKLDPALIRPGRIDREFRFELAKKKQVLDIFNHMFQRHDKSEVAELSKEFAAQITEDAHATAAIVARLARYDDPKDAVANASHINEVLPNRTASV